MLKLYVHKDGENYKAALRIGTQIMPGPVCERLYVITTFFLYPPLPQAHVKVLFCSN